MERIGLAMALRPRRGSFRGRRTAILLTSAVFLCLASSARQGGRVKLMQALLRAVFLAVVATGLTACQYVNEISTNIGLPFVGGSCIGKSKDKLRGVEWDKARVVEFRIRQGHFDPMLVQLSQNEPYVFRFVNRDEYEHVFRAPEFFKGLTQITTLNNV